MNSFSVKIPTKIHVLKYFHALYADNDGKISLNRNNTFGDIIITKLSVPPIKNFNKKSVEDNLLKLTHYISFYLPIDYYYRFNFNEVGNQQKYSVSRFLENTFNEDLYTIVKMAEVFGIGNRTAINTFAMKYGIDDEFDIKMESLERQFRRTDSNSTIQNFFLAQMSAPHTSLRLSDNSFYKKEDKKTYGKNVRTLFD